jgi:hypothetical protein
VLRGRETVVHKDGLGSALLLLLLQLLLHWWFVGVATAACMHPAMWRESVRCSIVALLFLPLAGGLHCHSELWQHAIHASQCHKRF